jgi:hypothetical protein
MKHGRGIYVFKSEMKKKREKGLLAPDVKVRKLVQADPILADLVAREEHVQAAKEICDKNKELHPLRTLYVLQYGAYPFYAGQYKENMKHGGGVMKNKDGSFYVGSWANNKRHGQGEMYFANGDRYVGQWLDGFKHGHGIYHFADKNSIFEGQWDKSQLTSGYWKMCDGNFYFGQFEENVPEGSGAIWFTDQSHSHLEAKLPGRMRAGEWIPSDEFIFDSK